MIGNDNFFYGEYKQVDSFFPNTDLGFSALKETGKHPEHKQRENLRKANALFKEAGWVVVDNKYYGHPETGEPLSFEILTDTPSMEKIALAYSRYLEKMGIKAIIRVMDSAAFRSRINDYDFDMLLYHWNSTLSPGTEQYLYWSCESAKTPSRWNYAGICDPEVDTLAKANPTAKTREELKNLAQNLDQKLQEGQYFVPLYYNPNDYVAYWDTLKRPEFVPLYGIVLETWWMEPQDAQ